MRTIMGNDSVLVQHPMDVDEFHSKLCMSKTCQHVQQCRCVVAEARQRFALDLKIWDSPVETQNCGSFFRQPATLQNPSNQPPSLRDRPQFGLRRLRASQEVLTSAMFGLRLG